MAATGRSDMPRLFGFLGFLLAVTLGLNSSQEEKKLKGGAVFNEDGAVPSQPKGSMSCPVRMGKSLLKLSPGLPSAEHPPAKLLFRCGLPLDTIQTQ